MIDRIPAARPRLGRIALGLALLAGCGRDPGEVPTYPTAGTVQVGGKPAPRALVQFHPVDPTTGKPAEGPEVVASTTRTEEDGRYALSTKWADDGVAAGAYVVTVQVGGPSPRDEGDDGKPQPAARPSKALAAYADKATSPLKATVKADGPNQIDLDVK